MIYMPFGLFVAFSSFMVACGIAIGFHLELLSQLPRRVSGRSRNGHDTEEWRGSRARGRRSRDAQTTRPSTPGSNP
jgi:hypothetical protein